MTKTVKPESPNLNKNRQIAQKLHDKNRSCGEARVLNMKNNTKYSGNGLSNKSLTGFKRLPQSPMVQDTPDDEGNKG